MPLFPDTTTLLTDQLAIGGCSLAELADQYGTPLYIYDLATLNRAVGDYRGLLAQHYPHPASVTYAGKAYLSVPMARWANSQGLTLDCTGETEIAAAVAAGLPRERVLVHGVNKSRDDLRAALEFAGTIVVDNLSELRALIELSTEGPLPQLWLRFQPGLSVQTHAHTQTGQVGSKFGLISTDLLEAARICHAHGLPLTGLHFHLGSQFSDLEPLGAAIQSAIDLAADIGFERDWHFSPGGGWGVAFHEDELPHPPVDIYARYVCGQVRHACANAQVPLPTLHLEPGRSLVARAGIALYRVGTLKRSGDRTWLLVDGGMTDNPRPALYGVRYSALPVASPRRAPTELVSIAGPHCESGDMLIENLPFPAIQEGELIAIPMSGAYQLSMSSNYNGARRPAVLMVADGQATLMQRRETVADVLSRDVI